jgi:S1-C subfamily serine protease
VEWDDEGLGDEPPASPLLPPDDRLWRHPSEVAAGGAPSSVRGTAAADATGRPSVVTAVALTSCLSVLLTIGVVAVVRPFRERVPVEEPASVPAASTAATLASASSPGPSVAALTARVRPAIAQVVARTADGERTWGSGVLIRSDGVLLTANHVVAGAEVVQVVLDDGRDLVARLVGGDPDTDIAVLDLEGSDYPTVTMAEDRAALQIGDQAITIGASSEAAVVGPLVRVSMVSAMNQEAGAEGRRFVDVIRTDTAVEPGCSGGAVVDSLGRVIGIAVSNMQASDGGAVGFATPIDVARAVADQLLATGKVTRAWLGIDGEDHEDGAVVRAVKPGSPSEGAGLRVDDVVVAVDGVPVPSMAAVVVRLRSHRPGDVLTLQVQRAGARLDVPVTLGEKPAA